MEDTYYEIWRCSEDSGCWTKLEGLDKDVYYTLPGAHTALVNEVHAERGIENFPEGGGEKLFLVHGISSRAWSGKSWMKWALNGRAGFFSTLEDENSNILEIYNIIETKGN